MEKMCRFLNVKFAGNLQPLFKLPLHTNNVNLHFVECIRITSIKLHTANRHACSCWVIMSIVVATGIAFGHESKVPEITNATQTSSWPIKIDIGTCGWGAVI